MSYMTVKRVIALVLLLGVVGVASFGRTDNQPTNEQKEFARQTRDLLHNEIVSALFTEFNETTTENVEQGKQAISLIFNNANRDIRLIGVFPPLQGGLNNLPSDSFERKSLVAALQGNESKTFERIGDRWYYRTAFPLSNSFHPNCVLCHSNFADIDPLKNPGQWVGALMLRVPVKD